MTDSPNSKVTLGLAWASVIGSWALANWSTVLSVACGVAAIVASIYSALASREKRRLYRKLADSAKPTDPTED